MTDGHEGPERRSAESLLARELVLVKRHGDDLRKELERSAWWHRSRRAKLERKIEISQERQGQILERLGGNRPR